MPNDEQDRADDERESATDDPGTHDVPERAATDFASRTDAVEALPLADRADAFAALHNELRTRLESGGTTSA
ncbi:hypothetical protein ACTJKO_05670 [Curtobacterium sp. 22159]|uniref:hypothetical protein n=1 Tax=Curtobacterium sp. 22159 TaxID=3453882 RepID=UPI003F82F940